jgi:hypothetical protein
VEIKIYSHGSVEIFPDLESAKARVKELLLRGAGVGVESDDLSSKELEAFARSLGAMYPGEESENRRVKRR